MIAEPVLRADHAVPRNSTFPNACGAMASRALAVSPTRESTGPVALWIWNLAVQRLTQYKYAEQGGHDKDQSLRYEGRYEAQCGEHRGCNASHAEKEQEKTARRKEFGEHQDEPDDEPSPPGEGNRLHRDAEETVSRGRNGSSGFGDVCRKWHRSHALARDFEDRV